MASWQICLGHQLPKLLALVPELRFLLKMAHWKYEMMKKIFGLVSMAEMSPIVLIKLKDRQHFKEKNFRFWK